MAEDGDDVQGLVIAQAAVKGWPAFSLKLFTNGPSTVNPSEAGFRPAIITDGCPSRDMSPPSCRRSPTIPGR